MATTDGRARLLAPLSGYRIGVVAHDGRQAHVDAVTAHGGEAVCGCLVDAVPVGALDAIEAAIDDTVGGGLAAAVVTSPAALEGWLEAAEDLRRDDALRHALIPVKVVALGPETAASVTALDVGAACEVIDAPLQAPTRVSALGGDGARRVAVVFDARTGADRLIEALAGGGAEVVAVPVAVAGRPGDDQPARRLVDDVVNARLEGLILSGAAQVRNLVALADQIGKSQELVAALNGEVVVACTTRACEAAANLVGLDAAVRPDRPRLGAVMELLVARLEHRSRSLELAGVPVVLRGTLAVVGGEDIWLAERERALLGALARRPGTVVAKSELLRQVWRSESVDSHAVEVAIGRLRQRLGPAGAALETVPRRGYRLVTGSR